ncbi:hypothetical protein HYALB_00010143 [Hymenoscyphus albidus]|uniref:Polyketide synthase n=1 Tax=Hymenoscyphus albidus TaxID=595503 RepID=A0A9N9M2Q4_9HELO|nr:hypothetical protein HYALB_00010143 [Hymenoscyphus albidus]
MDTACSSSLVALHQACQSLRNSESKIAIVGSCHLNTLPELWISMSMSRLFSDQGRSFSFDSRGTGYGRGEGCGIVILKPLEQALKDNDVIRSVILGSGINQDGKTPGITMPNGSAQGMERKFAFGGVESLMKSVYKIASLDPKDTGYVEAHGTGTKVGDPIEATALHNMFGEGRTARNPLFIGSVKSNIGSSRMKIGLIDNYQDTWKLQVTALMLERGFILPNYDFKKGNENIPFTKWHLKVPISQRPWPLGKKYASINNFGFGGTNAHVVMERAPFLEEVARDSPESVEQARKLFVLSANDKVACEALMKNIGIYLEQRPEIFQNDLLRNVAYTLGQRRSLFQWRVAISTSSSFELIEALGSGKVTPVRETEPLRIGFIFTGQGAQWNAMGRELYEQYPVFASTIDACDRELAAFGASFSLLEELSKDEKSSLVNEAHISQPSCTAIQLALTDLLRSWGISPVAVTGHSSGEIGAAYAADVLSLGACMAISYYRGLATISLKKNFPELKGSMMAVGGSKEDIEPLMSGLKSQGARIACFNSPSSLTISGDQAAVDEFQTLLEQKEIFNRKLVVDVAYHSHHMMNVAKEYRASLELLDDPEPTDVRFHSSLHGELIDSTTLLPSYWVDNLTQPVRFSEALTSMCEPIDGHKTGVNMLIEIGPHSALGGPVKQILKACGGNAMKIPYTSVLVRKKDAVETALAMASTLFVKGATLDLGEINTPRSSEKPSLLVDMPRYPWNHQTKYWHEPRMMLKQRSRTVQRHDLIGALANYSNDMEPTWRNILRIDDLPWLRHHKVHSLIIFPMAGFLSMAVEAAYQRAVSNGIEFDEFELRDVSVNTPLMVTDEDVEMTLQLRPHQEGTTASSITWDEFRIHSWAANKGWTEHCKGFITVKTKDIGTAQARKFERTLQSSISEIDSCATTPVDESEMYDSLSDLGVSYGPSFQGINNCEANVRCSKADITVVDTTHEMPQGFQTPFIVHPTLLEQLIDMYWPILGSGRTLLDTVYLASSIGRMTISRNITTATKTPGDSLRAFCKGPVIPSHPKAIQVSMFATSTDNTKEALIVLDDLTIQPIVERDMVSESEVHRELCFKLNWEPILEPVDFSMSHGVTNGVPKTNGHADGTTNGVSTDLSKPDVVSKSPLEKVTIVHGESEAQTTLACKLADALEHFTSARPETGLLKDVDTNGRLCLFIYELDINLLSSLTKEQFAHLQKILTNVQGILWVVRGAYTNSSNPDANMVTGLSRTIRSETLLKFATLDMDAECVLPDDSAVKAILKVFKATFGEDASENCELEFMERKGAFLTPRIINDSETNEFVHKETKASLEPTPFVQEDRPLKLVIGTPGSLETLHFEDQPREEPLGDDEIEIQVKAIGMNEKDVCAAMGQLDILEFGMECSGIVTNVGKGVSAIEVGYRVAAISTSGGVYSSYTRTKEAFSFKINDNISFETAASLPVAYCTTQYGLYNLGRLEKDERVLINGAESAFGHAAISLACRTGAEVFIAVRNPENAETFIDSYGLPADNVLSTHAICQQTKRGYFDVVFNTLPADANTLRDTWASLSSFGRLVEAGQGDFSSRLESSRSEKNKSFLSVDLGSMATERPKILGRLVSDVSKILESHEITLACSTTVFPISDIETAFRAMQSGNLAGKLIVAPQPGDEVKATPSTKISAILKSDATYILIGGTSGLGRSMARWMVKNGAKTIVLVSRTGSAAGKVKDLIDESAAVGATVVVAPCDVADKASVEKLITTGFTRFPQVKGVVHGAMVLDDVLFEKMEYEQYTKVIESKVAGAWNFHNALEGIPLDFFVAISSAAGAVGNRGQAAYSAANCFLNAFVQYRLRLGLPSTSIDLTAVSDVGHLAENAAMAAEVAKNLGSDTICEAEVLALLHLAVTNRLTGCNSHTLTGLRLCTPPPFWLHDAKFSHLKSVYAETVAASSDPDAVVSFHTLLKNSTSADVAKEVIVAGLMDKLPGFLMLEKEDMDRQKSLSAYALDSLVAIEVRNYITREFESQLQVLELLSSGSIEGLAGQILGKSKLVSF